MRRNQLYTVYERKIILSCNKKIIFKKKKNSGVISRPIRFYASKIYIENSACKPICVRQRHRLKKYNALSIEH